MSVVKFENEEEVRRSVAEVQRKDSVSGWVLVGYTSPTTLKMLGKGPGGVDEFLHLLQDDQIMYVLLRTLVSELRAEISVKITKDVLVTWVGPKVGKIERGKKNEHTGDVLTVLHPVHTHLTALTKVGFTDAKVRELTDAAAGSHVIKPADPSVELQTFITTVEADEEKRRQFAHNVISSEKKKATAAGTESRKMSAITLDAADRVQQEVATLLDRATPKGWVLLKYTANTNVTFQASGTGTTAELLPHLADDEIQYILLRLPPDTTENARTLDVFIKWVGPKVGRIVQGKKSEHVADVLSVLHPVHAELTALTKVGFTDDKVRELSVPTAGTHIIKLADQ